MPTFLRLNSDLPPNKNFFVPLRTLGSGQAEMCSGALAIMVHCSGTMLLDA